MNTQVLVHSSFLILIAPFIYLLLKSPKTPWQEHFLFHFLLVNFMVSVVFWSTVDKPYGWIHRMDYFLIRLGVLCVSVYVLLYKSFYKKMAFLFLSILMALCFKMSHFYSSLEWASINHLFYHRWLHVVGSIGICITFL
jgi:hypothetical protein